MTSPSSPSDESEHAPQGDLDAGPASHAEQLAAAAKRARAGNLARGAEKLVWETDPDNETAQRLYDGIGATSSRWLAYEIDAWS